MGSDTCCHYRIPSSTTRPSPSCMLPVGLAPADVLATRLRDETALAALLHPSFRFFCRGAFGWAVCPVGMHASVLASSRWSRVLGLGVSVLVLRLMPASPASPCLGAGIPLDRRQPPGELQAGQQPQQATPRVRTRHGAGECVEGRPIQDA